MGKKKFIDKKKSVTFQLLARDTSDPVYNEDPENDRVFVRVDNNPVLINGLDEDPNDSIYADAPEDGVYEDYSGSTPLPDKVRREILELGFPDDGYNYLTHLREIRNTGGGSAYFHNPKADLQQLTHDIKAYDASRVRVREVGEDTSPETLYNVAESTVNVRVQKALDPEIAQILEESNSEFGSDVENLEEDFVLLANCAGEMGDIDEDKSISSVENTQKEVPNEYDAVDSHEVMSNSMVEMVGRVDERSRSQRLLDEQFDMLERQEYGSDSDEFDDYVAEEDVTSLAEKLNIALNGHDKDDLELDGNYKAPAEILRRCVEYAEKYEEEDGVDKEVVIVEESSDESEIWDCETIVSTYSNLDNHPGRIGAPGISRKKRLAETISGALKNSSDNIISLGGRERLPMDYLPNGKKVSKEKVKAVAKIEQPERKSNGQESKEEKKERKAAVKEERREARRLKKEMKEIYRNEAKRAQKVAAVSGPSSFHIT